MPRISGPWCGRRLNYAKSSLKRSLFCRVLPSGFASPAPRRTPFFSPKVSYHLFPIRFQLALSCELRVVSLSDFLFLLYGLSFSFFFSSIYTGSLPERRRESTSFHDRSDFFSRTPALRYNRSSPFFSWKVSSLLLESFGPPEKSDMFFLLDAATPSPSSSGPGHRPSCSPPYGFSSLLPLPPSTPFPPLAEFF